MIPAIVFAAGRSALPAIVLAAGRSARMGTPKPSLTLPGGDTFLQRIVRCLTVADVPRIYIVLAADAPDRARNEQDLARWPAARVVINEAPERGQLSSLQCALGAVEGSPRGLLVTLVDLPLIQADTVRALVRVFDQSGAPLVRPFRNGAHGHPIVVSPEVAAALAHGDPLTGARPILRRFADRAVDVTVADDGSFVDIDTPEELARVLAAESGRKDLERRMKDEE
jgi:molybdenum cofactor cytidylyltransferase